MAQPDYDSFRANWKCALACILVSLSPFQYGIDFGLIGGIQAMVPFMEIFGFREPDSPVGWNISPEVQQLMGSLMTLGAVVASGLAGPLSSKLGRKTCLWIACGLCAISDVLMMATKSLGGLYAGRLLIGLANGPSDRSSSSHRHSAHPMTLRYAHVLLAALSAGVYTCKVSRTGSVSLSILDIDRDIDRHHCRQLHRAHPVKSSISHSSWSNLHYAVLYFNRLGELREKSPLSPRYQLTLAPSPRYSSPRVHAG